MTEGIVGDESPLWRETQGGGQGSNSPLMVAIPQLAVGGEL